MLLSAVHVQPPWPVTIVLPSETSNVTLKCLPNAIGWSVRRESNVNQEEPVPFGSHFNMFGIYKSEDDQFMFVNDTAVNNNTLIRCVNSSLTPQQTTLNVSNGMLCLLGQ